MAIILLLSSGLKAGADSNESSRQLRGPLSAPEKSAASQKVDTPGSRQESKKDKKESNRQAKSGSAKKDKKRSGVFPFLSHAVTFPVTWTVGIPVATVRGSMDAFSAGTEGWFKGKRALYMAPPALFLMPFSVVAGVARAPVISGENASTGHVAGPHSISLDKDYDSLQK